MKKDRLIKWRAPLAGLLMRLTPVAPLSARRWRRLDFSASARKMGIRLTESIRDRWRGRWVKVHTRDQSNIK